MAEGNWRCGMCAAHNEPSKHACMVCDTFRVLGARGASTGEGDLLAPAPNMFEAPGKPPGSAPPIEGADDLPRVRVMEPPPVRSGPARPGTAGNAGPEPGSEPAQGRASEPDLGRRERQAGIDTEPVPAVPEPLSPRAPGSGPFVTEPLPVVPGPVRGGDGSGHPALRKPGCGKPGNRNPGAWGRWAPTAWLLPRWPQGTVRALALAAVGATVLVLVWVLPADEDGGAGPAEGEPEGHACPGRIAALLPGTGPGPLVESFETERHRIVLCSNGAGELYYFGEFLDGSGEAMVVPAARTEEGYVADAGQTRYEIGGGVVVITGGDGTEIARLSLDPVPAPD